MKPLYLSPNITLANGELLSTWLCNYCHQPFTPADYQPNNYLLLVAESANLRQTNSLTISFLIEAISHQHCPLPQGFIRQAKGLNKS